MTTVTTHTSADAAGLLRAIIETPGDDALRLIYADWCEENGQGARAEFIRHGVRHPAGEFVCEQDGDVGQFCGDDYGRCQTCHEMSQAGVPEALLGADRYVIRRGFVWRVRCPLALWLAHGKEISRAHPVERWELSDRRATEGRYGLEGQYVWWGRYREDVVSSLPGDVWDALEGYDSVGWGTRGKWYLSEQAANDALSAALLALARA